MLWFFGVVLVSMLYLFNIEHQEAGRCHGDHHRYFLCGVFLIPCDAGGSGMTLRH